MSAIRRIRRLRKLLVGAAVVGLAGCSPTPPPAELAREWLSQADSAAADINSNEDSRLLAAISIAEAYARLGDASAARARLQQLETSVAGYRGADVDYRRGMAMGRLAAARQILGLDAGDEDLDAALSDLEAVQPAERQSYALLSLAQTFAADRLDGGAERLLAQAGNATGQLESLASRSVLYRRILDVYRNIGAEEQAQHTLAEIEESAWLEEDVAQQPVAIMRFAEVQALSGLEQQAKATMAVLPDNYHPAVEAALAIAAAGRGECDAATAAAASIVHAPSRASALIGVLEQQARGHCPRQVGPLVGQVLAALADETGPEPVIQRYALAKALIGLGEPDRAAEVLGDAVAMNRREGSFWNFDEFVAANLALARAGDLDQARALARDIADDDRRERHLAALAAVQAGRQAATGDTDAARQTAMAIADPLARVDALVGMATGVMAEGDR